MENKQNNLNEIFEKGLVFGFDVGTSGLGYAVRKGKEILDIGVYITSENVGNLKDRRDLRRMRRTIRSRRQRLNILTTNLINAGLSKPLQDEIKISTSLLRVRALKGEELTEKELFAALYSLWKHRGYMTPEWAKNKKNDKETGEIKQKMNEVEKEIADKGLQFPVYYQLWKEGRFDIEKKEIIAPSKRSEITGHKNVIYPRKLLVNEFNEIVEKQKKIHPELEKQKGKILYGEWGIPEEVYNTKIKKHKEHGGVYYQRFARFDNRKPAKCIRCGINNVCRTKAPEFLKMQIAIILSNFRVIDLKTGEYRQPDMLALKELQEKLESRKPKPATFKKWAEDFGFELIEGKDNPDSETIADFEVYRDGTTHKPSGEALNELIKIVSEPAKPSEKWLNAWAEKNNYRIPENQTLETRSSSEGRCAYCRPCLKEMHQDFLDGKPLETFQPFLKKNGETTEKALSRFINEIRNPTVKNRIEIMNRLIDSFIKKYGNPEMVIVEAVRSVGMGEKSKKKYEAKIKQNEQERKEAKEQFGGEASSNNILKFRLWKECKGVCPYCLVPIGQAELENCEIEHILPRAKGGTNQQINLTIAHNKCNEVKKDRLPFEVFGSEDIWLHIEEHVKTNFPFLKQQIFLSQKFSEETLKILEPEQELSQTSYIAKMARGLALIKFNWLAEDGRDPHNLKDSPSIRFQQTNGYLTANLRRAYGLDEILNEKGEGKNREDLRHHAIDALVIACTLPWAAFQLKSRGGWRILSYEEGNRKETYENPFELSCNKFRGKIKSIIPEIKVGVSKKSKKMKLTSFGKRTDKTGKEILTGKTFLTSLKEKDLKDIIPEFLKNYIETEFLIQKSANLKKVLTKKDQLSEEFINSLRHPGTGSPIRKVFVKGPEMIVANEVRKGSYFTYSDLKGYIVYPDKGKWKVHSIKPWENEKKIIKKFNTHVLLKIRQLIEIKKDMDLNSQVPLKKGFYRLLTCSNEKQFKMTPVNINPTKEAFKSLNLPEHGIVKGISILMEGMGYGASPDPHP